MTMRMTIVAVRYFGAVLGLGGLLVLIGVCIRLLFIPPPLWITTLNEKALGDWFGCGILSAIVGIAIVIQWAYSNREKKDQ